MANPQVVIPNMCKRHQRLLLDILRIGPNGPYQSRLVIAEVMLYQASSTNEKIWQRAEGNIKHMSLILAEIGCLACYDPLGFTRVTKIMKRYSWEELGDILHGRKTDDPDWPYFAGKEIPPE